MDSSDVNGTALEADLVDSGTGKGKGKPAGNRRNSRKKVPNQSASAALAATDEQCMRVNIFVNYHARIEVKCIFRCVHMYVFRTE
jgi:hypothetical protein